MKIFIIGLMLLTAVAYYAEHQAGNNGINVFAEDGAQQYSSLEIKRIYNKTAICVLGYVPKPDLTLKFVEELMDFDEGKASGLLLHEPPKAINIYVYFPASIPDYTYAKTTLRHEFIHLFILQSYSWVMTVENRNHTDPNFDKCLY